MSAGEGSIVGESETPLEMALRRQANTIADNGAPSVMYEHLDLAADELARFRAEVERLTAALALANVDALQSEARANDAEARAARLEDLASLVVPDLLEDMAECIESRQPDLYGYTNEHGGTVSIALYLCGLADRVRSLNPEGGDRA